MLFCFRLKLPKLSNVKLKMSKKWIIKNTILWWIVFIKKEDMDLFCCLLCGHYYIHGLWPQKKLKFWGRKAPSCSSREHQNFSRYVLKYLKYYKYLYKRMIWDATEHFLYILIYFNSYLNSYLNTFMLHLLISWTK